MLSPIPLTPTSPHSPVQQTEAQLSDLSKISISLAGWRLVLRSTSFLPGVNV